MRKTTLILISLILLLTSCDPGHRGKVIISNQSGENLILKYQTAKYDSSILILPGERKDVYHFGGIGEGRMYSRCATEFKQITLEPVASDKALGKSLSEQANWEMVNLNKWRYSNKEILCVFRVDSSDIVKR